ncbi:MAG TPA: hypothetical protein VN150_10195, partial [Ochrobactrum sp.]|nr:hypothetical protein [Ochrobactrum sp.]
MNIRKNLSDVLFLRCRPDLPIAENALPGWRIKPLLNRGHETFRAFPVLIETLEMHLTFCFYARLAPKTVSH